MSILKHASSDDQSEQNAQLEEVMESELPPFSDALKRLGDS